MPSNTPWTVERTKSSADEIPGHAHVEVSCGHGHDRGDSGADGAGGAGVVIDGVEWVGGRWR